MRKGLTLIELLMVIMILVTVTAAAVPMLAPGIETRKIREGSRGVSTLLARARSEAISKNRPVGVFFAASSGASGINATDTLFLVESQSPYCGDTVAATVRVTRDDADSLTAEFGNGLDTGFTAEGLPLGVVRLYDTIQLNFQGPLYRIVGGGTAGANNTISGNNLQLQLVTNVADLPWAIGSQSVPLHYKINRQPVKAAGSPTTLPTGVILDMVHSGPGDTTFPSLPATIMFAPDGSASLLNGDGSATQLLQQVFLLIGKAEGLMDATDHTNLQSLDSQWVTVNSRNGQTVSTENAAVDSTAMLAAQIATARQFARDMRGMGGK